MIDSELKSLPASADDVGQWAENKCLFSSRGPDVQGA